MKAAPRRWRRRLALAGGLLAALTAGVWYGVNHTSWMGPLVADGLRSVLGPRVVAWAEDTAYGLQDRVNRWRYRDAKPKTFWEPPPAEPLPLPPPAPSGASDAPAEPVFAPASFTPPFAEVAATGDGTWAAIPDPSDPASTPLLFRALVHPDARRGFAALAVVAIDRESTALHLVAGTTEPESPRVPRTERPGAILSEHHSSLVAAFNGGFKATHGQYGMLLDGKEYLPPIDYSCTLVHYRDGRVSIAPWSILKGSGIGDMLFYRQTPPCLVQKGEVEKVVESTGEYSKGWGATVSGETVIRRSSIGISEDGRTLFYGIGDAMTAQSLARGMKAAGAHSAAELDVNYSYPRFLLYTRSEGAPPRATSSIIPSVDFTKDQYVSPSPRDFFYLTREKKKKPS
ncbi:MAG: phosphodiester glycosidase family protein [Deltaproteobacteria bacterium]|nr:phosphodiester glycosidase family protein [Deltaproteobacteria bacterium]